MEVSKRRERGRHSSQVLSQQDRAMKSNIDMEEVKLQDGTTKGNIDMEEDKLQDGTMKGNIDMEEDKFHIIDFKELNATESLLMAFEETLRLVEKQVLERLERETRTTIRVFYVVLYRIIRVFVRAAFVLFLFGETLKRGSN
jgi:hypothetical protein